MVALCVGSFENMKLLWPACLKPILPMLLELMLYVDPASRMCLSIARPWPMWTNVRLALIWLGKSMRSVPPMWPQLASVTVLDSSPYPLTTFFQETLKDRIPSLIRRPAVSTFMDKVNGQGSRLFVRTVRIILLSVFHGSMVPVVQALCTLC